MLLYSIQIKTNQEKHNDTYYQTRHESTECIRNCMFHNYFSCSIYIQRLQFICIGIREHETYFRYSAVGILYQYFIICLCVFRKCHKTNFNINRSAADHQMDTLRLPINILCILLFFRSNSSQLHSCIINRVRPLHIRSVSYFIL